MMGGGKVDEKASKLELKVRDKILIGDLELKLTDYGQIVERIKGDLGELAIALKNEASMVYHRSHIHQLAKGLKDYVDGRHQFPRGTEPRPAGGLGSQPDERIAWTVELLPYIDPSFDDLVKTGVERNKSWNEGKNLHAAAMAIPYYLAADPPDAVNKTYKPDSWRHRVPGVRAPVAAMHFVGISGIGLDSASYRIGDPATAKKRGIFHYDYATKTAEITDGLDQTIALIQVPPTFRTCWLAGGGSTVRGVPETDSLAPFVCTEYKGKPGTFAIMADGKVRFIAADMNPETFKALCTIAGGEKIENLDVIAPVVPDNTVTLKPALPGEQPKPPVANNAPPVPPTPGANNVPPVPPAPAAEQLPAGWTRIEDKEGRYSVAMRTNGTERKLQTKLPAPLNNVTMYSRGMQFGKGEATLVVNYCDFPPSALTGGNKEFFDGVVAGLGVTLGKAQSEKEITIQGHPGREVLFDSKNGPIKARILLAGKRHYQLLAGGKPSVLSDKDVQTFLDSFKITN
jgi:hypothetical protein